MAAVFYCLFSFSSFFLSPPSRVLVCRVSRCMVSLAGEWRQCRHCRCESGAGFEAASVSSFPAIRIRRRARGPWRRRGRLAVGVGVQAGALYFRGSPVSCCPSVSRPGLRRPNADWGGAEGGGALVWRIGLNCGCCRPDRYLQLASWQPPRWLAGLASQMLGSRGSHDTSGTCSIGTRRSTSEAPKCICCTSTGPACCRT